MTLRIAIAGASGYAGGEVARLAAQHPELELGTLTAHRSEGRRVQEVHPHLVSVGDAVFGPTEVSSLSEHDIVVLALPHGRSGQLGEALAEANPTLTIVDLGADRRLHSASDWERFYGGAHYAPWVYGIPELPLADGSRQRDLLRGARRIAAPGCNASAVSIPLAPLVRDGLINERTIHSSLSVGTSGAGRTLREDLLASERLASATAYAVAGTHRHTPEIAHTLERSGASRDTLALSLTPMLVPMSRGILAVTTAEVNEGTGEDTVRNSLRAAYGNEPFVRVVEGTPLPSTGSVLGSNTIAMFAALDQSTQRVTLISALDNLVKGTAGAAIQSLNVALGFPETMGLPIDGVAP